MAEELAWELGLPVIQFNTGSTDKAKDDTPVDHEVQFIPAKIHHNGGQEVKTRPRFLDILNILDLGQDMYFH